MQQLCKRSLFCYYSIFEHHNLTCTGNSAHPVGDDEDGFIFFISRDIQDSFFIECDFSHKPQPRCTRP